MARQCSVRDLIEFVYRSGDIDQSFKASTKAVEGQEVHRLIQAAFDSDFIAEAPIQLSVDLDGEILVIGGRMDGLRLGNDPFVLEIKTTKRPLMDIEEPISLLHLYQAKVYAYMVAMESGYESVKVGLIYGKPQGKGLKQLDYVYFKDELTVFFNDTLERYRKWLAHERAIQERLELSCNTLGFPFSFRPGQRDLATSVYRTVMEKGQLLAEAPTGIGKTLSVLFPAFKAFAGGAVSKIFYLTPKTTGRGNAKKALWQLFESGLRPMAVELIAKEKICLNEEFACYPERCAYAKGHYDRIHDALDEALTGEWFFDREAVVQVAEAHCVCPFELSLDISLFANVVVCDYNYAFDPEAQLKRHFAEPKPHVLLIDEAHNLIERSRSMFSAELDQETLQLAIKSLKKDHKKLHRAFNQLHRTLREKVKNMEEQVSIDADIPPWLLEAAMTVKNVFEAQEPDALNGLGSEVLDAYFAVLAYLRRLDVFGDEYIHIFKREGKRYRFNLFCRDGGRLLGAAYAKVGAVIAFSATLSPADYFIQCLGMTEKAPRVLKLPSPYPAEHLALELFPVSTRFKDRERTYGVVADILMQQLKKMPVNTLVFFPSYDYLRQVKSRLEVPDTLRTIEQSRQMAEKDRDAFLESFEANPSQCTVGFCVMGGVFSEGIDLKADRLSCVAVIGVGLPMPSIELQLIEAFYEAKGYAAYDYTYTIPGMIRVVQAGGRLIRDASDQGSLLLIDDRYKTRLYQSLMPKLWQERCHSQRSSKNAK